jgi:cytochrome bd-type quinol oxidase subunit 2
MSETGRARGLSRLLVVVYAIFAIASTSRSVVQLATRFDEAPVAYVLSAVAALVYIVATVALALGERGRRVATIAIGFELAGVLIVGILSVVYPTLFPRATVWSTFGLGYAFIPLVLPIVGLWWLQRSSKSDRRRS